LVEIIETLLFQIEEKNLGVNIMISLQSKVKHLKSTQAIFLYVILFYLMYMFYEPEFLPSDTEGGGIEWKELDFILILCGGTATRGSKQAFNVRKQLRQAEVMLKSAVLFTRKKLHFHVITDSLDLFGRLVNRTVGWPNRFRRKLRFSRHGVWNIQVKAYYFIIVIY
jgi:hypothetical protein